jgi:predicted alpha-1,2-mannosidase
MRLLPLAALLIAFTAPARADEPAPDLVALVNPLMGSDSAPELSYGNTYPSVSVPWGTNAWTPQTGKMGDGWAYTYDATKIRGIKQTHQPSPWMNDYGAFALFAETGPLVVDEDKRASWFSHKAEQAHPHRYEVYLADYDVTAEVTPTSHAAIFRFTFPEADAAHILLDAFDGGSSVTIDPAHRRITGWTRNNHGGVPDNFRTYFVAEFSRPFASVQTWGDGYALRRGGATREGEHVGAVVSFASAAGEQVEVRVASSFIGPEQAQLNLDRETRGKSFDQVAAAAHDLWQHELSRIRIEGGSIDDRRTFYSCLWRMMLFPRPLGEVNAQGQLVHYSPYNGKVEAGPLYTDNGFWDTFRAVFPFFSLMYPKRDAEIMQGLANTVKEGGWLPEWASPGYRDVMIGSNSAAIIADAYLNGVRGFDIDTLYAAILKNANTAEGRPKNKKGKTISAVGREGLRWYNTLGYVPYDVGIDESAARTLEYAYDDFTISRLAAALGRPEDAKRFAAQAMNYRKLFDPSVGWMRGRNKDGSFQAPFNPLKWGDAFTEGNSLHYSWTAMQDIAGLIDLMGGRDAFVAKLDSVFAMPPKFDASYYGGVIHEIREMQIEGLGNYAHGNQPIQHMIYLYDYAGAPWKAQARIREVMHKLYAATPDGYPGDEDNGQTSAWYVWSALGFYPVAPATGQYVIGTPLFDRATLAMPSKTLTIVAKNNGPEHPYIQSATFDGRPLDRTWISHDMLEAGGTLTFVMGPQPNTAWASAPEAAPFSMSTAP